VGHNWTIFHSTAGPALAARDGAVMSASAGPAPGPRGMLTGIVVLGPAAAADFSAGSRFNRFSSSRLSHHLHTRLQDSA